MKRLLLAFLMLAPVLVATSARADVVSDRMQQIVRQARAAIVVPTEWDGVWTSVDTTYSCAGAFQNTSTSTDTICGGKDYSPADSGSPVTFDCTGTATATTYDMTCTGSTEIFPDCTSDYTITVHGTLSGGTYFMVTTLQVNYSGTATGCDLVPPTCNQYNSHGTRIGPAPTAFCATPTKQATWGRVKSIYR